MLSKPVKTLNHSKANPSKKSIAMEILKEANFKIPNTLEDFSKEGIDGGELNADAQQ